MNTIYFVSRAGFEVDCSVYVTCVSARPSCCCSEHRVCTYSAVWWPSPSYRQPCVAGVCDRPWRGNRAQLFSFRSLHITNLF